MTVNAEWAVKKSANKWNYPALESIFTKELNILLSYLLMTKLTKHGGIFYFFLPHGHPESPRWGHRGPYWGCGTPAEESSSPLPFPAPLCRRQSCMFPEWRSAGVSVTCRRLHEYACPPEETDTLTLTHWTKKRLKMYIFVSLFLRENFRVMTHSIVLRSRKLEQGGIMIISTYIQINVA